MKELVKRIEGAQFSEGRGDCVAVLDIVHKVHRQLQPRLCHSFAQEAERGDVRGEQAGGRVRRMSSVSEESAAELVQVLVSSLRANVGLHTLSLTFCGLDVLCWFSAAYVPARPARPPSQHCQGGEVCAYVGANFF